MTATQQDNVGPAVPTGRRIYAVGDIHGRLDLLDRMIKQIVDDAAGLPDSENVMIFLGDYVDRGPDSCGVLDRLSGPMPDGFEIVFLKGNHEDMMLRFLAGPGAAGLFFGNDGETTLTSYGYTLDGETESARLFLLNALPDKHIWFLHGLKLMHVEGDYLFVHAGVRPGISIGDQMENDLMWIRETFLGWQKPLPKVVVHGHSVTRKPEQLMHRIGIDTEAWRTGLLTCLVLEGTERRFLST